MTQYEKLLSTIPCFRGLHRRELRIIAGLVDVVVVPAGGRLSRAKGEVIVAVQGHTTTNPDGTMLAVTQLRLFVFGRRELLSLFGELPDLVLRILLCDDTTAPQSTPRFRRLRSRAERGRSEKAHRHLRPRTSADGAVHLQGRVRQHSSW